MIGRVIGTLFLLVAAVAFLRDALNIYDTGQIALLATDQLWFTFDPNGFASAQTWGEATLPFLWDPVITTLLSLPTFMLFGVIGVLFLLGSRKRPRRRRTVRAKPLYRDGT